MQHALTLNLTSSTADTISLARSPRLLSPAELDALDARIASNADNWLADNAPKPNTKAKTDLEPKRATGRKPKSINNPFFGFIGCTTYWGRYPAFASDVIEGVARLDWHDRPVGVGGKSMPLSVRDLTVILESLPDVTTESVMELLRLGARHARRYVKAIELIMPWMMVSRPRSLCREMEGIDSDPTPCAWKDQDALLKPSAEELAKLHYDLRTLTQYKSAEEYETEEAIGSAFTGDVVAKTSRQQHSKKYEVLSLLAKGTPIKAIERETRVQPKTIRKWRNEVFALAA
ncbi:hypothetical protein [Pseudomonas sp. Irchel s3b2]|uniref:hypothetical protein n=1 Tax=Pseudomonas sp. Irchel s3b2 TaxID=2009073 RepID=UPI000BA468C3|nr:hypothetical protein [Pseudomonas sp. Irchel s3b2]